MPKKRICLGCGIPLQNTNVLQEGYTANLDNPYCERCFRIKNYGEYQVVTKSNEEYVKILKSINRTKDLVLLVVDIIRLEKDLSFMKEYLKNPILLVLNKCDLLPRSVSQEKILTYLQEQNLDFVDIVFVSAKKKYHLDELYQMIKKHQTSNKVYVVGNTNVGKSSLINQMISSYSKSNQELTISPLPATTLNKLEIVIDEGLTIVDTPGLIDNESIANYVDSNTLKRIQGKKEIRPKTFQLKPGQGIIIENLVRMDYIEGERNSFTVYVSNDLKVKRINALRQETLKDLYLENFDLKYYEDIVISGLGWIKVVGRGKVAVYLPKEVSTYTRKNLI